MSFRPPHGRPLIEGLEPRILCSGDLAPDSGPQSASALPGASPPSGVAARSTLAPVRPGAWRLRGERHGDRKRRGTNDGNSRKAECHEK